jgi:hypothetical protein
MTNSCVIALSALALFGRIFWNYLPYGIDRVLAVEVAWSELRDFLAYLIRADVGAVACFEFTEAPYLVSDAA